MPPVIYFKHAGINKLRIELSESNQQSRYEALFYFEFGEKYERRAKKSYEALMYRMGESCEVVDDTIEMGLYDAYKIAYEFMSAYKYPTTWHSQFPEFILDPTLLETNLIKPFIDHLAGSTPTYIVTPDPDIIEQTLNYLLGPSSFRPHHTNIFVTSDPIYRDFHDNPYITIVDDVDSWIGDLSNGSIWCMFEHARVFPIDTIIIFDHKNEYFSHLLPFGQLPPHRKLVYISTYVIEHRNFPFRPVFEGGIPNGHNCTLHHLSPNVDIAMFGECETFSLWDHTLLKKDGKHPDSSLVGANVEIADVIIYRDLPKLGVFIGHLMEASRKPTHIVYIGDLCDHRYGFPQKNIFSNN